MATNLFYFLRKRGVDLLRYLPTFLAKDATFKDTEDVLSREHESYRVKMVDFAKQFFIETATWSLPDWEEMVGVKKLSDDLEARRARVRAKLMGSEVMTIDNVNKMIRSFTDGISSYVEEMNVPNEIKLVMLDRVLYWQELIASARELLPAHLGLNFERQGKSYLPVNIGNAFAKLGYQEVGLPKPSNSLIRLHAGIVTTELGLRGGIGLPKPPILSGDLHKIHAGIVTMKGGEIIIGCDMRDLSNRPESFTKIREVAIADALIVDIGIARPSGVNGDREPEPHEDEDDDDFALADGNWIRPLFNYPTGQGHPILLINPREDLIVGDVEEVGNMAAKNAIFLNSKAEGTTGIDRADLIRGFSINDESDDLKLLPSNGVLRLFFEFSSTAAKHKILLKNIRGGITIGELKKLGRQAAASRILINAYNEPTRGISHAAIIKRFKISKENASEPIKF